MSGSAVYTSNLLIGCELWYKAPAKKSQSGYPLLILNPHTFRHI